MGLQVKYFGWNLCIKVVEVLKFKLCGVWLMAESISVCNQRERCGGEDGAVFFVTSFWDVMFACCLYGLVEELNCTMNDVK